MMQKEIPSALLIHTEGEIGFESENKASYIESRFKITGINTADENGEIELSLSSTFRKCAKLLEDGLIRDFTLTRTTMSEVFTDFAKFQINAAAKGDDSDSS